MHDGMLPVRLLLKAKKFQSLLKLQIESGSDPLKLFEARLMSIKFVNCPIEEGMVPESVFEEK